MSSAFVKEGDHQELSDIGPTINALIRLLTYENGGIRVYEKKRHNNPDGTVYEMSNGLQYRVNKDSKWEIVGL